MDWVKYVTEKTKEVYTARVGWQDYLGWRIPAQNSGLPGNKYRGQTSRYFTDI